MNLKFDLTKALLLTATLFAGWVILTFIEKKVIDNGPDHFTSSSSSAQSESSSSSAISPVSTISLISTPTTGRTAIKKIAMTGSITGGMLRIIASTKDPKTTTHGEFLGIGIVVASRLKGELLSANAIDSQWIGNGTKRLSPSRSPGLLLPGQRRIYEYDLSKLPVSNDYDAANSYFPSGTKNFNLISELKESELHLQFYTTEPGFGVIESIELLFDGTGEVKLLN